MDVEQMQQKLLRTKSELADAERALVQQSEAVLKMKEAIYALELEITRMMKAQHT